MSKFHFKVFTQIKSKISVGYNYIYFFLLLTTTILSEIDASFLLQYSALLFYLDRRRKTKSTTKRPHPEESPRNSMHNKMNAKYEPGILLII